MSDDQSICDVCTKPFNFTDDRVEDDIKREFPDRDICPRCYGIGDLAGVVSRRAIVNRTTPQAILQQMLDNYNANHAQP